MSSKTNCFLLILFSLPLWSTCQTISSSCPEKCGSIYIPYPFGIGKGCYLENWYAIECVNNSVPILSIFGKEVVSIHLIPTMFDTPSDVETKVDQTIRIKTRILSKGCSSDGDEVESSTMNLTGTPFYFDNSISLIAVGCNNTSSLTHIEPTMVGCKSSCGTKHHTPTEDFLAKFKCYTSHDSDYNYCANDDIMNETSCNGNGCCQANMPGGFHQTLGVKIDNETTTKGCKVAFLTDKTFKSHGANPQRLYATQYSTIRLGWFIHTTNRSYEDSLGCSYIKDKNPPSDNIRCNCDHDTYLNYSSCLCSAGYEGNPYVMGGCEDVDECPRKIDDPVFDICGGGTCINTEGGYRCVYTNHRSLAIG